MWSQLTRRLHCCCHSCSINLLEICSKTFILRPLFLGKLSWSVCSLKTSQASYLRARQGGIFTKLLKSDIYNIFVIYFGGNLVFTKYVLKFFISMFCEYKISKTFLMKKVMKLCTFQVCHCRVCTFALSTNIRLS